MMEKAKYFAVTLIGVASFWGTVFWIIVPYIADDIGLYLKKPTYVEFLVGFIFLLVCGALIRYVVEKLRIGGAGSSNSFKGIATTFLLIGSALSLISLARIGLPFLSSATDIFIPKAKGSEFIFWFVLLALGSSIQTFGTSIRRSRGDDLVSKVRSKFVGAGADDILAKDPRPPILYLRSFNKELEKATYKGRFSQWRNLQSPDGAYLFSVKPGRTLYGARSFRRSLFGSKRSMFDEQMVFADVLNRIGPYIAIGRPTETFENMDLGAAKKFVSDDKWQDAVIQWLSRCAAVVLEAGDSDGLSWEMRRIVERVEPTRLLMILPSKEEDYEAFRRRAAGIFPLPLPDKKAASRLLTFDGEWRPVELQNVNLTLADTLEPFFEQNLFEIN
ncbi:MAG: hypothetical protein ACREGD_05180 [Candidatus Saccharimonadales bacterium]